MEYKQEQEMRARFAQIRAAAETADKELPKEMQPDIVDIVYWKLCKAHRYMMRFAPEDQARDQEFINKYFVQYYYEKRALFSIHQDYARLQERYKATSQLTARISKGEIPDTVEMLDALCELLHLLRGEDQPVTAKAIREQAGKVLLNAGAAQPKEQKAPKTKAAFQPPTLEDVQAYCKERGSKVDAVLFYDHYTANGWVQGKGKPIKDWKACFRTWERNELSGTKPKPTKALSVFSSDASYDIDEAFDPIKAIVRIEQLTQEANEEGETA